MKGKEWDTPNKMHIETGHATFDRQTNIISHGNIIANTMLGWHIRAWTDTTHWQEGKQHQPGYLQNFDLDAFVRLPGHVRDYMRRALHSQAGWLYQFYSFSGNRETVHGYVLTANDHTLIKAFYTGPTYKSWHVIDGVLPYVAELQ